MRSIRRIRWTRREPSRCRCAATTRAVALGGPLRRDKVFFFGSAEHINEERQLDFKYPDTGNAVVNQLLREQEAPYDVPTEQSETRAFVKFDERFGTASAVAAGELHRQRPPRASCRCRRPTACRRRATIPIPRGCSSGLATARCSGNPGNPYVVTLRAAIRSDEQRDASVADGLDRGDALQSV